MPKYHDLTRFVAAFWALLMVAVDQLLKAWAYNVLRVAGQMEVIPGLFYLTYVENRGAAFGIFQGQTALLAIVTGVVLAALLVMLLMGRFQGKLLNWTVAIVFAGGLGNLIDRVWRGFVVDFLDFSALFNFPVFNFADCCVVIGAAMMLCYIAWTDFSANKKTAEEPLPSEMENE